LKFIKLIENVLLKTSNVLFAGTVVLMFFLPLHATGKGECGINPRIFIAENAKIYGIEHLHSKQNTPQKIAKTTTPKTKSKAIEPVINEVTEKKLEYDIAVTDFPLDTSSLYYSYINKELAVSVSQQKHHDYSEINKGNHRNTRLDFENSDLSLYLPIQRQKFSSAAIQCGILTSFIPNSPPL